MSKQKQKTICVHNMFSPWSKLVVFMYWTGKSMNNLLSYCGLVDVRINASDKDLPLQSLELEVELQKSSKVDFEKQVNPKKLFWNVSRNTVSTKFVEGHVNISSSKTQALSMKEIILLELEIYTKIITLSILSICTCSNKVK